MKRLLIDSPYRTIVALLPPVMAFLLQWFCGSFLQPFAWLPFYPAVFFSAWLGGMWAGVVATLLSAVAGWWFFMEPRYSFALAGSSDVVSVLVFVASGILFSVLHGRLQNALAKARASRLHAEELAEQLDRRIQQRSEQLLPANVSAPIREARFASVIESATDAIISMDCERRIVLFNAAAEAMFGCAAQDALDQHIDKFIPDRCRSIYAPYIDGTEPDSAARKVGHSAELFGVRNDGSEFPVEASISNTYVNGRQLITMILRDITQRRLIEASLRTSEARFHGLFDGMLEGCQIIGFDWRYLYINEAAARNSRTKVEDRLGKTMMEVFPGVETSAAFARMERCMRERIAMRHESRIDYPDGTFTWFDVSTQPAPDGLYILAMDVTERKQALVDLQHSGERLQQIADSLPQLIWTALPGGICDFTSRQWREYTGLPAESHAGMGWLDCVHPEDHRRLLDEWFATDDGAEFRTEARLRRHDGAYRWFDIRATSMRDAQGRIVSWFCSNTDIDDRRRASELQLRSQKMEALGTLSGGIAHDFNNILLAIKGNARLAIEDLGPGHAVQVCLGEIDRASSRATELVRRILAFSRQEETRREIVQLQPVIEEALDLLRATLPAIIELRSHYEDDVPPTLADSSQVHQIIMNLATNAAHAIGARAGIIEVTLDTVNIDADLARSKPGLQVGQYVRMTVCDNGSGMDRATLDRIFDPFFTTKPVGEGTGLGLSMVDGIMKSHDGAITVYSQLGKGTSFRLYFPVAKAGLQVVPERPVLLPKAQGQRVLYVDDDRALVFLAERTLNRLGYSVTGVTNPREAIERFRNDPFAFDVVVTDLSMPLMSGTALTRDILALRADIPVVITSGYLRPEDHELAAQLGAAALILKPNSVEELGQALNRIFGNPAGYEDD